MSLNSQVAREPVPPQLLFAKEVAQLAGVSLSALRTAVNKGLVAPAYARDEQNIRHKVLLFTPDAVQLVQQLRQSRGRYWLSGMPPWTEERRRNTIAGMARRRSPNRRRRDPSLTDLVNAALEAHQRSHQLLTELLTIVQGQQ